MRRPKTIGSALDILRNEEAALARRLQLLKTEQDGLAGSLKRVRGALASLADGAEPGLAVPDQEPDSVPPAHASSGDVLAFVQEILRNGVPKSELAIKAELFQRLRAMGRNGTGVHLVLRQVLNHPSVVKGADGYELRTDKSPLPA